MSRKLLALCSFLAIASGACADASAPDGTVSVVVVPSGRGSISEVRYTLSVSNESGRRLWTKSATQMADEGLPGFSAEGVCDAGDDQDGNGVTSGLIELSAEILASSTPIEDIHNSAPVTSPMRQPFSCRRGETTTIEMRPSFVDRAAPVYIDPYATFPRDGFFCSAKLDCSYTAEDGGEEPILLLLDETGERARTLIVGFRCIGGADAELHLYMDDLEIDCGDAGRTVLTTGGPDGSLLGPAPPLVFEQATYRGRELVSTDGPEKLYWNVALGIAEGGFPMDAVCTLRLRAAGSAYPLEGDLLRANDRWGTIRFEAQLNTPPGDALTCGRNNLGDPGGEVAVDEAPFQAPFTWVYP